MSAAWQSLRSRLRLNRLITGRRFACAAATVFMVGAVAGCASQTELKGMETRLSNKEDNTRTINARNAKRIAVEESDRIANRIMTIGFILMGLTYPIGKLIWIIIQNAKDRAASVVKGPFIKRRLNAAGGAG